MRADGRALPRLALVSGALLLGACDRSPAIEETDLSIRVAVGADEVGLGAAFPVTVVRVWSKDLVPVAWDDRSLAPLGVRLEGATRREDASRVEETRRYRAYAFSRSDVRVPAPRLVARPLAGGPDRAVRAEPLVVRVRPLLDPTAPGAPEPPGPPLAEPAPRWPYAVGVAALLALLALALRRRRRPAAPPPAPPPTPPPAAEPADARALAALARVRARDAGTPADLVADVEAVADVVRVYVADRFAVPTAERTSEELVASAALPEGARAALRDVLARCDRVKYAAHAPGGPERLGLLDAAEAFVRATALPRASPAPAPAARIAP